MSHDTRLTKETLGKVLTAGMFTGAGLLVLGGGLALMRGELAPGLGIGKHGLNGLGGGLLRGESAAVLRLAILVLIMTPVLRVIVSGILLGRAKDRVAVMCTIAVLGLLILAFALDVRE